MGFFCLFVCLFKRISTSTRKKRGIHQMIAVPTVATWGRVEHRRHTELAKLPDTKTVLLLHSSALVRFGTGPDFHSFRVNIQKSTRRVRGPLAAASTSGLSAPPAAVVSPCCVCEVNYGMRLRSLLIVVCLCGMCVLTQKCTRLFKSSTV